MVEGRSERYGGSVFGGKGKRGLFCCCPVCYVLSSLAPSRQGHGRSLGRHLF